MIPITKSQLVTLASALLAACAWSTDGSAEKVGTASAVNPAATINMRTLTIGSSIAHMERIRTESSGSVQVLFIDKTSMTIGPNSDVTIDNYVFDPKSGTGSLAATVGKGALRFVGGLISHNGQAEVKTATASIGIRGGIAIIRPTDVFVGYGSSTVTSSGTTVPLGANEYTQTLGGGAAPTIPGPPPVGFVQSLLQNFQSTGGQSGGARPGTASPAKVAAAENRATGTTGGSVAGSLTPTPVLTVPPVTRLATSLTSINQSVQTSTQTGAVAGTDEPTRPTITLQGSIGGIDRLSSEGTRNTALSGNSVVALDAAKNRVQANFTAFGNTTDSFQFGSLDPSDPTHSSYTDYNNFGASSKVGGTFNGIPYNGEMFTVSRDEARQAAINQGVPNPTICQCDYTRWGFWTVQNPSNTESILGNWVAGRPAQVGDVPATGAATYIGHVMANVADTSGQTASRQVSGNFSNIVNFGTRTGDVSVTSLDHTNYSGRVALQSDPRNFGGTLAGDVGNRNMGLTGSFFRSPSNPVGEMGGSVTLSGTNYTGGGIFAAALRPGETGGGSVSSVLACPGCGGSTSVVMGGGSVTTLGLGSRVGAIAVMVSGMGGIPVGR